MTFELFLIGGAGGRRTFEYSFSKGVILADTKFEFGLDNFGKLFLIDEIFTPDSSRFWDKLSYKKGLEPLSFDKQFIRNYLNANSWNRKDKILFPPKIINQTSERYELAKQKLIGKNEFCSSMLITGDVLPSKNSKKAPPAEEI